MRWTKEARRRVARMVWAKSVEIDDRVRAETGGGLDDYMIERDRLILHHFALLGFCLAGPNEWKYERDYDHPAMFRPNRRHLLVLICTQHILRVEKELAEKILVIGLP